MKDKVKVNLGCLWPVPVIIFLAFFGAKIFDKIDWSWWWVFSPLWIPACIVLVLIAFMAFIYILTTIFSFNDYLWK